MRKRKCDPAAETFGSPAGAAVSRVGIRRLPPLLNFESRGEPCGCLCKLLWEQECRLNRHADCCSPGTRHCRELESPPADRGKIEEQQRARSVGDTGWVSRENIDAARRVLAAVSERDVTALLELTDPEVQWRSFFAALLERGEYRGHDALRQYFADLDDAFEVIRPEPVHMLDVGDLVVAVGTVSYRGRASGVETEEAAGWVFTFENGKVVSWRAFRDPERALAVVGLETEAGSD